jgi:hypothetical protein
MSLGLVTLACHHTGISKRGDAGVGVGGSVVVIDDDAGPNNVAGSGGSNTAGSMGAGAAGMSGGGAGGAAPMPPTSIEMTPPPSLTLDGQAVMQGQFVVTEAVAHIYDGAAMVPQIIVDPAGFPVIIDATIGFGSHVLFEVPAETDTLEMIGYFDASVPDLPQANFNLTIFGSFMDPVSLTVFLPSNTAQSTTQITGAGVDMTQNINIFTDQELPPEAFPAVIQAAEMNGGQINPAVYPLNVPISPVPMTMHGTAGAIPAVPATPSCACLSAATPVCCDDGHCCPGTQICSGAACMDSGGVCPPGAPADCATCCPGDTCCPNDLYCCGDCDTGCN